MRTTQSERHSVEQRLAYFPYLCASWYFPLNYVLNVLSRVIICCVCLNVKSCDFMCCYLYLCHCFVFMRLSHV